MNRSISSINCRQRLNGISQRGRSGSSRAKPSAQARVMSATCWTPIACCCSGSLHADDLLKSLALAGSEMSAGVEASGISKVETNLSTCPAAPRSGQVDSSFGTFGSRKSGDCEDLARTMLAQDHSTEFFVNISTKSGRLLQPCIAVRRAVRAVISQFRSSCPEPLTERDCAGEEFPLQSARFRP